MSKTKTWWCTSDHAQCSRLA